MSTALHTVHGTFKLVRGVINADSRGAASGMIEVDASSADSGLHARDERLKKSVLETWKFPQISFLPDHVDVQVDPEGRFHGRLHGVMTIHGSAHDLIIDAEGHVSGDELVATCHFVVPYVEWGMKDPSVLLLTVAKRVDVDVATAGRVVWGGALTRDPSF